MKHKCKSKCKSKGLRGKEVCDICYSNIIDDIVNYVEVKGFSFEGYGVNKEIRLFTGATWDEKSQLYKRKYQ